MLPQAEDTGRVFAFDGDQDGVLLNLEAFDGQRAGLITPLWMQGESRDVMGASQFFRATSRGGEARSHHKRQKRKLSRFGGFA
jgi:hypothetical protein